MTVQSFVHESADAASLGGTTSKRMFADMAQAPARFPAANAPRGLVSDPHIASLVPGEPLIDDRKNLAAAGTAVRS
jgi:hypothetical protein